MKRIVTFAILAIILGLGAQAQHLSFKGISMEGSTQAFATKLAAKGFKHVKKVDGVTIMEGPFAGFKNCTVGLVSNDKGNIFKAAVIFPEKDTWGAVMNDYAQLKAMMVQKYGDPTTELEEFEEGYLDDYLKKHKVTENEVTYGCAWNVEGGSIEMMLVSSGLLGIAVRLSYFDQSGQEEAIQSAIDDL